MAISHVIEMLGESKAAMATSWEQREVRGWGKPCMLMKGEKMQGGRHASQNSGGARGPEEPGLL